MKPASFAYHRPTDLEHAVSLLSDLGEDARVIAGGQSLLPAMVLRVARPTALVDIARLPELRRIEVAEDCIVIGAAVTHSEIRRSDELAAVMPVLRSAAARIAHLSIRERGTFGGSIANADPASEWPCIALTFAAKIHTISADGRRTIAAADFFLAPLTTALEQGEIITHITIPRPHPDEVAVFDELAPQHGAYGLVLVAIRACLRGAVIADLKIGVGGCGGVPELVIAGDENVVGRVLDGAVAAEIGDLVAGRLDPDGDNAVTPEDRRQIARALVRRNLAQLGARART